MICVIIWVHLLLGCLVDLVGPLRQVEVVLGSMMIYTSPLGTVKDGHRGSTKASYSGLVLMIL